MNARVTVQDRVRTAKLYATLNGARTRTIVVLAQYLSSYSNHPQGVNEDK